MTTTKTADVDGTLAQIYALAAAGADIVRCTCNEEAAAEGLAHIVPRSPVPIVADIHFHHEMALAALEAGVQGLRLNPGNLRKEAEIKQVAAEARDRGVPIRIGVNAGSLHPDLYKKYGGATPEALVESARNELAFFEEVGFNDVKISVKASSVALMIAAYRLASETFDHPLHLGVTEAGPPPAGLVKGTAGIGTLLAEGIGDTIRYSLTADPVEEARAGRQLLESLGLRERKGLDLIACPSCGRAQVDVIAVAKEAQEALEKLNLPIQVAVMGCVVNGPGEAREADLGIAAGKQKGHLFIRGKIVRVVPEADMVQALVDEAERLVAEGVEARMAAADASAEAEAEADRRALLDDDGRRPQPHRRRRSRSSGATATDDADQLACAPMAKGAIVDAGGGLPTLVPRGDRRRRDGRQRPGPRHHGHPPWGYGIWELMQAELDRRIKEAGAENAYFPLFIPESFLKLEAEHVEGFAPELAVVTHGGGKELEEPLVVRPDQRDGDQPASSPSGSRATATCRCSSTSGPTSCAGSCGPRLFLRTSEFLWQEGHTAHATEDDARAYALRILQRRLPLDHGRRAAHARAHRAQDGARALRRRQPHLDLRGDDGRRQGAADGHEPRARPELRHGPSTSPTPTPSGTLEYVWQTSWGVSTRLIGALVMGHGDDFGLRLPPGAGAGPGGGAGGQGRARGRRGGRRRWSAELAAAGHRVRLDDRTDTSFGRRSVDWELKGVPVRVEIGPRDLAEGNVTVVTRHRREKQNVRPGRRRPTTVAAVLGAGRARAPGRGDGGPRRPGRRTRRRSRRPSRRASVGFARVRLGALGPDGEDRLAAARPHRALPAAARRVAGRAGRPRGRPRGRRGPVLLTLGLL